MATTSRGSSPRAASAARTNARAQRFTVTGLTTVGMFVLFGAYCLATWPLGRPSKLLTPAKATTAQTRADDEDPTVQKARRYLAHAPWAASKDCLKGQTSDGLATYYFQEWKQESETVVRFHPFALIWKRKDANP